MERKYEVGQTVKFTDAYGKVHDALVCAWHIGYGDAQKHKELHGEPSINIVYVTDDSMKRDSYGQQIERHTSVVHKGNQWAAGMFWKWSDEE